MTKLKVIESYHDSEIRRVLAVGEIIQTPNQKRAEMLIERGLVEAVKQEQPTEQKQSKRRK